MITPHSLAGFLPVLFWAFLIGLLATAVTFAVFAAVRKLPSAIWVSGGALILALLMTLSATTSIWPSELTPAGGSAGALIALLGVALAVFGGGPAAQLALELATRGSVTPGAHGGILVTAPTTPGAAPGAAPTTGTDGAPAAPTREVLRGGAAIGVLERLCVVLGIVAGFPEAIAIVIAVKGLGRFTELAAAEARERFIIGTLASLLWASACAVLVRLALG